MTQYNNPTHAPSHVEVNALGINTARPLDRVRWGPILAGLFAALSLLALLSVLGLAIGLSAYDPGDRARAFGIGAGFWGLLSMLLAFFLGGWLAARSAAVAGRGNGLLNGAMVWAVAIPLMLYLLAGGVTNVANTAANAGSAAASAVEGNQQFEQQVDRVISASANDPRAQQDPQGQQTREQAIDTARNSAWWTFASLLLGLAAAAVGGAAGARHRYGDDDDRDNRNLRRDTSAAPPSSQV